MDTLRIIRRLFRKAVRQGRSKQRGESYSVSYVEPLRVARTPLADFINSRYEDSAAGAFSVLVIAPSS